MDTPKIYKTETHAFRETWIKYIHLLQAGICEAMEAADGGGLFGNDDWERTPGGKGGGGKTRVMENGNAIEKGGVNSSVVYGQVSDAMRKQLKIDGAKWFACGLSLVIHPLNPYAPAVHANWRYFELYDEADYMIDRWFGGGTDLTPSYLFEEDAVHFHQTLKEVLDGFGKELYPAYKKNCDDYFSNAHRNNEMRGIGGIFYDYLRPKDEAEAKSLLQFQQANGNAFLQAYLPILNRRKSSVYGEAEKRWQEIRRGRYVEFNLIHDRGTLFGLKTRGRTESILMSLPPGARWVYNDRPAAGSRENELLEACLNPREWV